MDALPLFLTGLCQQVDRIDVTRVINATARLQPHRGRIPIRSGPGRVRGLRQVARSFADEGEFVTLTFVAALDAEGEGDTIKILGRPALEVRLSGANGDIATAAIAVNAIRPFRAAAPGLLTLRDLPLVAW